MPLNQKLTDKPLKASFTNDALVHIVEPNDLTQGADGSDYKMLAKDFQAQAGQDNIDIRKNVNILSTDTYTQILGKINSLPNYTVNEKQSVWFICRQLTTSIGQLPRTIKYKMMLLGKGNYGVGGTQLTFDNLENIFDNTSTLLDIENDPTTDKILYGDLVGETISEWLNVQSPAIVIQPQEDGYTLFEGSIDGINISYLWIGEGGVYGLGDTQSTMADFQVISDEIVSDESGFVNANLHGYLPTNTASDNVAAMQAILDGGNKTIIVPMPGTYLVNGECLIDSNTEIIFGEGVIIQKSAAFGTIFMNRGAYTRTYNENITLRGLTIKTDGFEGEYVPTSPIYGVRGNVNFYYAKKVKIYDIECTDIGTVNWLLSFNRFEDVLVEGVVCEGMKDCINWGNGKKYIVRNVYSSCYDDTLGLNPFGYPQSSPEVGSLIDGLVENIYYKHNPAWPDGGRVFNFQMGAVSDWYSGKMILTGDIVNAGGNTYIAIATPVAGVEVASVTEPTIEVFNNVQDTGEGIQWRIQKLGETTAQAQIENIVFRNIVHDSEEQGVILTYFAGNDGTNSRTVHPDVLVADYPEAKNIKFDGLKTKHGYFNLYAKLGHNTEITGLHDHVENEYVILSENTAKTSNWNFHDNNFGEANTGFVIGNNGDVIMNNNIQNVALNVGGLTAGRFQGNTNIDADPTTTTSQIGDLIRVNGVNKRFNGTAFVTAYTLDDVTDIGNVTTNEAYFGKVIFGESTFISNQFSVYTDPSLGSVFIAKNGTTYEYFFANSEGDSVFRVPVNTVNADFQGTLSAVGEATAAPATVAESLIRKGQVDALNANNVKLTGETAQIIEGDLSTESINSSGSVIANSLETANQIKIGSLAPADADHATRKDYVDGLNAGNVKLSASSQNIDGDLTVNDLVSENTITVNSSNITLLGNGKGIELKSPDGTGYYLTVSNAGALVITAI